MQANPAAERPDSPRYRQQRQLATEAAAQVFAEKGYHGATTADIAAVMGIKQGSLYYYFANKQEALLEVCLLALRDYLAHMELIAGSRQSVQARLQAVISAHLGAYREKHEALKVYNNERLYLSEEQRGVLKAQGSRYRQLLQDLLQQGLDTGDLQAPLDANFAALSIIGLCNAWGELIVRDEQLDVFEISQRCTELLLNGLLPNTQIT